ncbi:Nuclear pore complex protein Nup205 [Geodia barretti]|uniref:Nuclear pore complex protein Nup205 n=1 Tax=Geodia barretti TaxID=519541 RepID=A0AA35WP31_GEOBA|nr:Nuclear pore complex protein Nup205 [Geodia barretti]
MFNDSHLLKKVLMIIDECGRILATPGEGGGVREGERESVAGAALLALQMVESALEKQDSFFSLMRQNNLSVMVTPLDQLLLGINPRSGLADHFINIASYMSLTWETPELALSAVNILISSSHSVKVAKEMAVAISNNKKAKSNIIHGFVEHLEWEGPDTPSDDPAESPTATVAGVHRQVQLGILRLLSDCVGKPPNIAHLLLGFEARRGKQISETTLQDPGVLESPRTVLHSLLSLVQHSSDPRNPIGCHYGNPKLAELCYKVIFQLCSHHDLSTPTLRYLRNNHDFFHAQLSAIPLDVARLRPAEGEEEEGEGELGGVRIMTSQQVSLLHQQAWLLKAVAIEMRVTAETQLRSHNQRLVDLLMSEKSTNWNPVLGHVTGSVMSELTEYQPELSIANEGQRKILVLLDLVTFEDLPLPPLQAEFEAAIQSCDTEDPSSGLTYTDVRQLHQMMMTEVNSLRGGVGASAQRHSLLQEVQSALEVVVLRNSVLENRHGNTHLFRGWRQVVEISLHSLLGGGGSNEGRGGAEKKEREISVLFELIQGLLARVEGRGRGALSGEVFRVLLVLMSHLSFITTTAVTEDDDSLLTLIFSAPLQSILRDLLTAVQQTPGAMQLARAHLYGALLYFLTVSRQQHSSDSSNHRGQTGLRLEWSEDSLAAGNLATIASFGEPLMEIVCRDASSGHDVTRMLSLSLLDAMFSIDRDGSWLRFIVSRGYLAKLAASLLWEDEALQKMLHPLPDTAQSSLCP